MAIMNSNTAWHWGQGDHDADMSDSDDDKEQLALEGPGDLLELTYKPPDAAVPGAPPLPPDDFKPPSFALVPSGGGGGEGGGAPGSAMVPFEEGKAKAQRKRQVTPSLIQLPRS